MLFWMKLNGYVTEIVDIDTFWMELNGFVTEILVLNEIELYVTEIERYVTEIEWLVLNGFEWVRD